MAPMRIRLQPGALLSVPVFLLTLLWVILIQLAEGAALGEGADGVVLRLLSLFAVQVLMFAFPLVTWRVICPRVRSSKWNGLLLVSLIVGAVVRGVTLGFLLVSLGVTQSPNLIFRILASLSHMALVVVLLWFLVSEVRTLQSRRRQLLAERDQLLELQSAAQEELGSLGDRATEEIRQSILQSLGELRATDSAELRERIRVTIDDVVRPLSRTLAGQSVDWVMPQPTDEKVRVDWWLAIREGLDPVRIHPVIVPILLVWFGLPFHLLMVAPMLTVGLVATLIVTIPSMWLARRVAIRLVEARGSGTKAAAFVIAVMVGGLALGVATVPYMQNEPRPFVFVVVGPLLALLISGPLAIAEAARSQDLELESALEATTADLRWTLARAREQYRQQEGALAHALHGRLQASLAAAYLRLGRAVARGADDETFRGALRTEVRAAVAELDAITSDPDPIDRVVALTQSNWAGAAQVTFMPDRTVNEALALDPLCTRSVNDLIPELVFNSIRHGEATSIDVRLEAVDRRTMRLTVTDNGGTPLATAHRGLGTALLDQASISWSRTCQQGCTTTTCLLPIASLSVALSTQ